MSEADVSKRICSVEDCGGEHCAQDLCEKHYRRLKRHGDPLGTAPIRRTGCKVPECARLSRANGFCTMHNRRFSLYGDPMGSAPRKVPVGPTITTCSVDGCEKISGPTGTARGYCGKHYNRWLRTGDPIATKTALKGAALRARGCEVDGCSAPYGSGRYCVAHYSNWLRHGEPSPRKRGEVRDGKKVCAQCDEDLALASFKTRNGRPHGSCRRCESAARQRRWRSDLAANRRKALQAQKANPQKARDMTARRRAQKRTSQVEKFSGADIFERDGWTCQICGDWISTLDPWPNPGSPSVDHRVPLAAGGSHTLDNCQASHLACNMAKGARATFSIAQQSPSE